MLVPQVLQTLLSALANHMEKGLALFKLYQLRLSVACPASSAFWWYIARSKVWICALFSICTIYVKWAVKKLNPILLLFFSQLPKFSCFCQRLIYNSINSFHMCGIFTGGWIFLIIFKTTIEAFCNSYFSLKWLKHENLTLELASRLGPRTEEEMKNTCGNRKENLRNGF